MRVGDYYIGRAANSCLPGEDFVVEMVATVKTSDLEIARRRRYDPPAPDEAVTIDWALTGPHPACPRCGSELHPVFLENPCLGLAWTIYYSNGHKSPCGLPCFPSGITYYETDFPQGIHFSKDCCPRCKQG